MVRFAENVSTGEIIGEIERLLNDSRDIREIDLYLQELQRRKLKFKYRILTEMVEPIASIKKELRRRGG